MSNASDIQTSADQPHRQAKSLAMRPKRHATRNWESDWYKDAKRTIAITEHDGVPNNANRRTRARKKGATMK
jgi:hypothetical protein